MKTIKIFPLFLIVLCSTFYHAVQAQNKDVNEPCTNDSDCRSGKCLELRNGKKVCGTCTQDRLVTLSNQVDKACKDEDKVPPSASNQGDISMDLIEKQIEICKECIVARKEVLHDCFYGNPDKDHVDQVVEWEGILNNNIKLKNEKASSRNAYYGTKSDYEAYLRNIDSNCNKNFQQARDDAERRKQEKGGCSDLESWIKSCEDCVYQWEEFKKNSFRGQMSGKREEELGKHRSNLRGLQEVLNYKKSNNLCN